LSVTYYDWILSLHPSIPEINAEFAKTFPIDAQVAPTAGFGIDRFVTEARDKMSTWDMYIGITPFLEMIQLTDAGVIEPWDPYLPEGMLDSLIPAIRAEGTYNGNFYVWPFLLDVTIQGWNAGLVEQAGLDPEKAPTTWDELIANAKQVQEKGVAPFGLTFDFHAWRSLIPITHSISTDVYDPDTGIFQWNSDPAVQALEIMKEMIPLANPDVLNEGTTDAGVNGTPDEQAFASQLVAYYVKYQNAHLRFSSTWPDPSKLRLAALPKTPDGAGGTVFWTTGAGLMTYGQNKEQAGKYMNTLTHDERIWAHSLQGDPAKNETAVGQLPVYQTLWDEYAKQRPDWMTDWAIAIKDGLGAASAIHPTKMALSQFTTAAPFYVAYLKGEESDAKAALTKAMDAVMAEYAKM
ncbi:MAG: extracellular solute-binding protein, partial [Thermomicrobiales bacterium]|nr:extracellular solute-binding protein [Thermomicrobiales bacterium]